MEQQVSMTTSTATSLSEEFAESTVEGSGGTKLKRASSWKKFKDTVKGWVGSPVRMGVNSPEILAFRARSTPGRT